MKITELTDIGVVRSSNQDSYKTGKIQDNIVWAVVCDGMGGVSGGDIASKKAVDIISDRIVSCYSENMKDSSIVNMLESAIHLANIEIFDYAKENGVLSGMGTTVVAALITDKTAYISHAGDSRAYIANNNEFKQITVDHSVVQEMVDRGEITKAQAEHHPIKNYITRALGATDNITVDFNIIEFTDDDIILICTDGLSNMVKADEIFEIIKNNSFESFASELVKVANKNGGTDNITVVAVSH